MPHRAVIDGEAGPIYNGVSDLAFRADGKHVAYAAERGTRLKAHVDAVVVQDGKEGKGYEMIVGGSLRYLPDDRLAYIASRAAPPRSVTQVAVIDGVEGPEAEEIVFSPDGKHVAAVAGGGDGARRSRWTASRRRPTRARSAT